MRVRVRVRRGQQLFTEVEVNSGRRKSRRKTKWLQKFTHYKLRFSLVIQLVWYTKTIIHLSVGETGGYLPPLR